jgi:hypothetical protein
LPVAALTDNQQVDPVHARTTSLRLAGEPVCSLWTCADIFHCCSQRHRGWSVASSEGWELTRAAARANGDIPQVGAFQYPVAEANTARMRHALPRCRLASAKLTRAVSRSGSARPASPSKPTTAARSRGYSPRQGSSKEETTLPPRSVRVDRASSPKIAAPHAGVRRAEEEGKEGKEGEQQRQQQEEYRKASSSSSPFPPPHGK